MSKKPATVLTKGMVDQQLECVRVDSTSRKAAVRAIEGYGSEFKADDDTIRLYLALHALLKPANEKVTRAMMMSWTQEAFKTSAWNQQVWVVVRLRQPELARVTWFNQELQKEECVGDYMIDPTTVGQLPAGLDAAEIWLVDDYVPKSVLGGGVTNITVSVGAKMYQPVKVGAPAIADGAVPEPRPQGARISQSPPRAAAAKESEAPPAQRATLKEVPSDPDDVAWPVRIGRKSVALVGQGRWKSSLFGCPNNVLYYFDQYVEHIASAIRAEPNVEFPPHVLRYIDYISTSLLGHKTYYVIKEYVQRFKQIKDSRASMAHPTLPGFEEVAAHDITSKGFPTMVGLTPETRPRFVQSVFFGDFMEQCVNGRFRFLQKRRAEAKGEDALSDADLCLEMHALLETEYCEHIKAELQFAATLFSKASALTVIRHLMSDLGHFQMLRQWRADDPRVCFQPFVKEPFACASVAAYLKASRVLASDTEITELVKNAVVRACLGDFKSLRACVPKGPEELVRQTVAFAEQLFVEISLKKLGEHAFGGPPAPAVPVAMPPAEEWRDTAKSFHKVVVASYRKYTSEGAPGSAFQLLKSALDTFEGSGLAVTPAKSMQPTSPVSSPTQPPQPQQGKEEEGAQAQKLEPQPKFKVGDLVLTSFGKNKDKWDVKKGRVEHLYERARNNVMVRMLEGNAVNEAKDFDAERLTPWKDPTETLVPLAGVKRTAQEAGLNDKPPPSHEESLAAKADAKVASEALADDIFGKQLDAVVKE